MTKNIKFVYLLSLIFMIPLCLFVLLNTLLSLFQTTYMETMQIVEIPLYKQDRFYILIIFFILTIAFIYYLYEKTVVLEKSSNLLHLLSLVIASVISIWFLYVYKSDACCDSKALADLAVDFLAGDYSSLIGDEYLVHYPHQVGMIGFLEIIFYLFGKYNYLAFQILNLIAILFIVHLLHRISELLFHNVVLSSITSLLSMGLVPLFSYVTFVYGDVLGLAFALGAITFLLLFLQNNNYLHLIPCSVLLSIAMLLKSNNSIILVACIITLILHTINQKKWQPLLCAIGLFLITTLISNIPTAYYSRVSGVTPFPSGTPKIAWVAMALQENDPTEDGWYNGYNWHVYSGNKLDIPLTKAACYDSIKTSINTYISDPKRGVRFLYHKFKSQWNDPGYQSQITNEWSSRHKDSYTDFYNWLVFGRGKKVLEWIMNLYQFLILASTLIALPHLLKRKNSNLSATLLPLCIFGGYTFHLFWEAKIRYALPYFIMMVPLASYGIYQFIEFIAHKYCKPKLP